jgi:hypothetical protein
VKVDPSEACSGCGKIVDDRDNVALIRGRGGFAELWHRDCLRAEMGYEDTDNADV